MPAELAITITRTTGSTTVELSGELDVGTAEDLRTALDDVHGPVRVDLERLSFMDAHGVGVLHETARTNGAMTIVKPAPLIRRILGICQMDPWLADGTGADGASPDGGA